MSYRWLPSGVEYAGVFTTITLDGSMIYNKIGARPDREYRCMDPDAGCFEMTFSFTQPENEPFHEFVFETEMGEQILTGFETGVSSQGFDFCIEGGYLARQPTPAPTISALPTPVPSRLPTLPPTETPSTMPTGIPTHAPTMMPTNAPSQAPTQEPSSSPTREPSTAPTNMPTQMPSNMPTQARRQR